MIKSLGIILLVVGSLISAPVNAFGANGHRTIAAIAERVLTPPARLQLQKIIGSGNSLAEISTWPDEIRSDPRQWGYTFPWHYISIDDDEQLSGLLGRNSRGDILSALADQSQRLSAVETPLDQRWQALAWVVHLIGDLHQPLHVGKRNDRGGNSIQLRWFGQRSNLHRVWDSNMIELLGLSYTEYVEFLADRIIPLARTESPSNFIRWAEESKALRVEVYRFDRGASGEIELDYDYAYRNRELLDRRILQAGVRLGLTLNELLVTN